MSGAKAGGAGRSVAENYGEFPLNPPDLPMPGKEQMLIAHHLINVCEANRNQMREGFEEAIGAM